MKVAKDFETYAEAHYLPAIKKKRADGHKRTTEALKRIVDLYQAWGKPEVAGQWQAHLPE